MKTKICGKCKKEKNVSEFHKNPTKKDGVQSMCKECRKKYHRKHYLANKEKYCLEAQTRRVRLREEFTDFKKTLKCSKCGEDRWYVLDFHHRNPDEKEGDISRLVGTGRSEESIKKEIEKCDILCSNCHKELHYFLNNENLQV